MTAKKKTNGTICSQRLGCGPPCGGAIIARDVTSFGLSGHHTNRLEQTKRRRLRPPSTCGARHRVRLSARGALDCRKPSRLSRLGRIPRLRAVSRLEQDEGGGGAVVQVVGEGAARRLTLPLLSAVPGLAHGFTVLGSDPDAAVADASGGARPLATLRQVHGRTVRWLLPDDAIHAGAARLEGDAFLTARRDAAVGVATADCVPILLAEETGRFSGAVHAGWRGTVASILAAALEALQERGADLARIRVGMGPCIGPCCFEVGDEVVEAILRADPGGACAVTRPAGGRARVDLLLLNRRQAAAAGVPERNVAATPLCTVCRPDLLESYRRSGGRPGRMVGFVAWRSGRSVTS
jgi:polyphenol oxidase